MLVGDFTFDPELRRRAASLVAAQFRGQPMFAALVEGLAAGAQLVEDQAYSLVQSGRFRLAVGDLLDQWGDLVNEPRSGLLDDDVYRRFIQAAILCSVWDGWRDQAIEVWEVATAGQYVRQVDRWPRCSSFYTYRPTLLPDIEARRVRRTMNRIKPPGVFFRLIEVPAAYLGFDGDGPFEYGEPAPAPRPQGFGPGRLARSL